MPGQAPTRPTYAAAFRCIGPACEDHCCQDWNIPIDRRTYAAYQQFPPEQLGALVSIYIKETPTAPENLHAHIQIAPGCECPFFGQDGLCRIHKTYGAALLSATCSIYPRALNEVGGVLEGSLTLSCPEAARNILLTPGSTEIAGNMHSGDFRTDNVSHLVTLQKPANHKPYGAYLQIRELLLATFRDRSRPLWHRMLLAGVLCQQLDAVRTPQQDESLSAILTSYRRAIEDHSLDPSFEAMPANPALKLEVILKLFDERTRDPSSGRRFQDTFWTVIEGIGTPIDEAPSDDLARFQHAAVTWLEPFLESRPWLLENYLLNYVYERLFPFGREGAALFHTQGIFAEYLLLATQFAWVTAILTGVAAHHRERFAEEHVIKAVQSYTRAVEHYPQVLLGIVELVTARGLGSLEGMAVLLRP